MSLASSSASDSSSAIASQQQLQQQEQQQLQTNRKVRVDQPRKETEQQSTFISYLVISDVR